MQRFQYLRSVERRPPAETWCGRRSSPIPTPAHPRSDPFPSFIAFLYDRQTRNPSAHTIKPPALGAKISCA